MYGKNWKTILGVIALLVLLVSISPASTNPDGEISASYVFGVWAKHPSILCEACSSGSGGPSPVLSLVSYKAAVCQHTAASLGFSLPVSDSAVAACSTGANTQYGIAQFADGSSALSVQDHFPLPPDWTGDIDVAVRWRTSATTGDVVWQIQTACVADGEVGDPVWNPSSVFLPSTAKPSSHQWKTALKTAITVTGCAAGSEFFFKFFRDPMHSLDTLAGTAELISLTFKIRRMTE